MRTNLDTIIASIKRRLSNKLKSIHINLHMNGNCSIRLKLKWGTVVIKDVDRIQKLVEKIVGENAKVRAIKSLIFPCYNKKGINTANYVLSMVIPIKYKN
jgi:hypothetical protein